MPEVDTQHDIIVVSDLHIGRGVNPQTRRYHVLETFFYDADFLEFCRHLCTEAERNNRRFHLVLNGDVFDFLRIDPDVEVPRSTSRERRFGPTLTPQNAATIVGKVLAGHPQFVEGLALCVARGHRVIFLPGNHDLEVHWECVQRVIREAILLQVPRLGGSADDGDRVEFRPWFYHEPGRIWVEHGCQYDPENAFRFPLRGPLTETASDLSIDELDMPLGNFFQRYLYNAFGSITFIVPSTRANSRYSKWLLVNEPLLLLRVLKSHGPFVLQLLRRFAKMASRKRAVLQRAHEEHLTTLAESSGLGARLRAVDALKSIEAHTATAAQAILSQGARMITRGALALVLGAGLFFTGLHAIGETGLGFGFKALLSVGFNLFLLLAGLGMLVRNLLQVPDDSSPRPLRTAAQELARILDVPIITFGHTHDEVVFPLRRPSGGAAWYYNTGTWIAVFTHDVLLPRERVQFTFLQVQGLDAQLMQWSPGRGKPLPVVLIDERQAQGTHAPSESMPP